MVDDSPWLALSHRPSAPPHNEWWRCWPPNPSLPTSWSEGSALLGGTLPTKWGKCHPSTTPSQFFSHQNPRIPVITFMLLVKRFRKYPVARLCCGQPPPFILLESLPLLSMSEWSCRRECSRRERSATKRSSQSDSQSTSSRLLLSLRRTSLLRPSVPIVRRPSAREEHNPHLARSLARSFFRATDRGCTSSSSSFTAIHIQITGFVEKHAYHCRPFLFL